MIESLYFEQKIPKRKKTLFKHINAMVAGSVVCDIAAMVVPIQEDEFVKNKKP